QDFEGAIDYNVEAIELLERIGHIFGLSTTEVNLAWALMNVDELDEAERHCEIGLRLAEEIGGQWTLADGRKALAEIHLRRGDAAEAARMAEQAAALFSSVGDQSNAEDTLELAARAYGELGDAPAAEQVRRRLN